MLRSRSAWPISPGASFSFLFLLACCLFTAPLGAKTRKPSPTPSSKEDLGLKNIPLTVGHEAKGLVLPNYDVKGHLLGRFAAATANRIDDQHVHFSNLKMQTYDEHEKPDFNIDMTDAILNLETRVLESKERSMIKRIDFEIAGDSLIFNTVTHQGTLKGSVHMTIFDKSQLTGRPKS